jgi:hypothetical protein
MQLVQFVFPADLADDNRIIYIGELREKERYPTNTKVRMFASFSTQTPILAPLLLLSDFSSIGILKTPDGVPLTIQTEGVQLDIEERLDDVLHRVLVPKSCLYREVLGPRAFIAEHSCLYHGCGDNL